MPVTNEQNEFYSLFLWYTGVVFLWYTGVVLYSPEVLVVKLLLSVTPGSYNFIVEFLIS